MPEEKRKINAWIPVSLYNKLESAGYDNITQALIKALESFREDPQEDITGYIQDIEEYKKDIAGYKQNIAALIVENDKLKEVIAEYHRIQEGYKEDISRIQKDLEKQDQDILGYTQDIKALNNEIERLREDLARAPDPVIFAQLQGRIEGLQEIVREKDRSIERLENDLKKADLREEDLKSMHNNYMLQVQSLINARALMPSRSTEGEKPKQESKPAREKKESGYPEKEERLFDMDIEDSPAIKESPDSEPEKGHIEKICKYCEKPFFTDNIQKEYCSKKHKDQAYNEKRKKERENRKKENNIEE
jgi:DNA repair exonuclease SbcCD ATPase subunit